MNKNLKLTLFLLPCSICIYGCTYYKNVPLSPVSESKLSTYAIYKPNVTLEKIETNEVFIIRNFMVKNDSIFGTLIRSEYLCHNSNKTMFMNKNGGQPLKSLHLYTNKNIESGTRIKFPSNSLTLLEILEAI